MTNANNSIQTIQEKSYEIILNNLGTTKQSWLDFLTWHDKHRTWMFHTLKFLFQTEQDLKSWGAFWDGDIDNLLETVSEFKEWKIEQTKPTLSEFVQQFQINKQFALENLFQEEAPDWMLIKLLGRGISAERIFVLRFERGVEHLWNIISQSNSGMPDVA